MSLLTTPSQWNTELINSGADALAHLYYINFVNAGDNSQLFTVRNSEISGLPSPSHKTETKSFQTIDLEVPKCEFDYSKKLTLSFRLDYQYKIYEELLKLMRETSMASVGYATSIIGGGTTSKDNASLFNMEVIIPSGVNKAGESDYSNNTNGSNFDKKHPLYTFKYCWVSKISGLEDFSDSSGSKVIKADIYYYSYEGPESWASK